MPCRRQGSAEFRHEVAHPQIARGAPLPWRDRLGLVRVALANFFRHILSAPNDYKSQIKQLKKEILMLRQTCEERRS